MSNDIRHTSSSAQRLTGDNAGLNGKLGGPSKPKPNIIPKPQFPSPQKIREDFLP